MRHLDHHTPISARVQAALAGDDPTLIREVEMLERIASAGVVHVAANGKWPHWPIDRWITVLGFTGVIVGGLFFAGSQWTGVERDIHELKAAMTSLTRTVGTNRAEVSQEVRLLADQIRQATAAVGQPAPSPGRTPTTPVFPRDDRFSGVGR
jgi:hypothetical protein